MNRLIASAVATLWYLLIANTTFAFNKSDTLRGSNGPGRVWWDATHYDLSVAFDFENKAITGKCTLQFSMINRGITPSGGRFETMQIDLQEPMEIDSVVFDRHSINYNRKMQIDTVLFERQLLHFTRTKDVYWIDFDFTNVNKRAVQSVVFYFHGKPRTAVNPPWDGGFSWTKDAHGNPWVSVSCQGLGASVWWPCKDAQWDEPDLGVNINLSLPKGLGLTALSNGRCISNIDKDVEYSNAPKVWKWEVKNPINLYDVTFYIGQYAHFQDTLMGEKGPLSLDFWVLKDNLNKAKEHFKVVKPMLHCYEYWLGAYPFYEDGYKLVEAPYLGMEHQSAVAYGNNYQMGYKGFDRSKSGTGMLFDYIIIHETAHEWFGNNVTAADNADNWVHEGITTYSEALFVECTQGQDAARKYSLGDRSNILNNKPIIGAYGVNNSGSSDMYSKGAAIMFMIRKLTNNDDLFRKMLRGLGHDFYHRIVTTQQIEQYIADKTNLDLKAFFNHYLRNEALPQLEYYIKDKKLNFRFKNTADGFSLPISIKNKGKMLVIHPTNNWQSIDYKGGYQLEWEPDFLITVD